MTNANARSATQFANVIDGRYRLETELGRGGFGAVYRATQLAMGVEVRHVALKLFHEGAVNARNLTDKLNDAIRLIQLLDQLDDFTVRQHFIEVYDLGVTRTGDSGGGGDHDEHPRAFIAMELVRGGSLQQRMRDLGRLNVRATLNYLLELTRAIGFMHTRPEPVIHRDLKPDNILLLRCGEREIVKVADFGLAKALDSALSLGEVAGTLAYMAPVGLDYDTAVCASDVYSIGLIAYEMLFGRHPFARIGGRRSGLDAKQEKDLHRAARKSALPIRPEEAIDLSAHPKLADVLARCVAYDLDQRYPDAQKLHEDLCRIRDDDFPSSPADPPSARDVFDRLQREVDFLLREEDFSAALKAAQDAIVRFPASPEPYLMEAQVGEAEAELLKRAGNDQALRFLGQAADRLIRQHENCPRGRRNELMRRIAHLYQKMGDQGTATVWLDRAEADGRGMSR